MSNPTRIVARAQLVRLLEQVKGGHVSVDDAEKQITFTMECNTAAVADWLEAKSKEMRGANKP